MGQIWLTSDEHFGHPKLAGLRGFETVAAHDKEVIANLRRVVRDGDEVWHLGDVALGDRTAGLALVASLPGSHHLVLGNHDRAHPLNTNGHLHTREYLDVFASVQTVARINYRGLRIMLSHFPYNGDTPGRGVDRYAGWRLRDEGSVLLHGHTHSNEWISRSAKGTVQVHVGVDAWGLRPVTLHEALTAGGVL